jgi:hypothetical protein
MLYTKHFGPALFQLGSFLSQPSALKLFYCTMGTAVGIGAATGAGFWP